MTGPILLQIILIFLNATFASAEIAVISTNENKLRRLAEEGDKRAKKLSALTEQPAKFLATIQVAITLAGLLGSAFAAESFAQPLVETVRKLGIEVPEQVAEPAAVIVITLILAYFNLVFGELVPKRIAMKKAERLALGMSGMLYGVSRIFAPLVFLLTVSTNGVLRLLGINPDENDEKVTEEEIRMLVAEGKQQGIIDEEENTMLQNVFEFDDLTAEELLTHRLDLEWLDLEDDLSEWEKIVFESRHSFYPVCSKSVDQVTGVLDTADFCRMERSSKEAVIEKAVDKPFFVPETMKANLVFREMKQNGVYFAPVIDEYGGLSGIITLNDLLEALVGELPPPRT